MSVGVEKTYKEMGSPTLSLRILPLRDEVE